MPGDHSSSVAYVISLFRGQKGKKKGEWQKIAQVFNCTRIVLEDQKARLGDLKLLAEHERNLLDELQKAEQSRVNEPLLYCVETKDATEVLTSYLVDVLHFRRGTVYIMVQKSNNGIRLLAYGTNKIHHAATCFGTSPMDHLTQTELENRMSEAIVKLKNPEIPKKICDLIQAGFVEFHC